MIDTGIIETTQEHVDYVAARMRKADIDEIWASSLQTPKEALQLAFDDNTYMQTGIVKGEPVCIWGVSMGSLIGPVGHPWMLGTEALEGPAGIAFLRRCRKPLKTMRHGYGTLLNYVDARNIKAIKWLRFMGFTVSKETEEYGALKLPFHRFEMEGDYV